MLKRIIPKLSITCCLLVISSIISLEAAVTRAAFDVGSGSIKVTVADVDPTERKINSIHYAGEYSINFKRDMEASGNSFFSEQVQSKAIDIFSKLKADLAEYQPKEWVGIATAASRQSSNAQELYDKIRKELGINISIIPQKEEGRLGFVTALAASRVPNTQLVCLDSGGASVQLTTQLDDQLEIIEGQIGNTSALSLLVTEIRKQKMDNTSSPNPVTLDEAVMMTNMLQDSLPYISEAFEAKLADPETVVVGIGHPKHIFAIAAFALGKNTFTKEEVWNLIVENCNLPDDKLTQFVNPSMFVVKMILLHSYMEGLGIDKITSVCAYGNCEGLLVDPAYWTIDQ